MIEVDIHMIHRFQQGAPKVHGRNPGSHPTQAQRNSWPEFSYVSPDVTPDAERSYSNSLSLCLQSTQCSSLPASFGQLSTVVPERPVSKIDSSKPVTESSLRHLVSEMRTNLAQI
jgi:hypothetical protein